MLHKKETEQPTWWSREVEKHTYTKGQREMEMKKKESKNQAVKSFPKATVVQQRSSVPESRQVSECVKLPH